MKNLNHAFLLCTVACAVSMAAAKPSFAETVATPPTPITAKAEQCGNDSFPMYISDWTETEEASIILTTNVRARLRYMLGLPSWSHVKALTVSQYDKPYISQQLNKGPYNALVTYKFCWELKDAI